MITFGLIEVILEEVLKTSLFTGHEKPLKCNCASIIVELKKENYPFRNRCFSSVSPSILFRIYLQFYSYILSI
jgi:hypothetical protein